jgi:hypothetical protein
MEGLRYASKLERWATNAWSVVPRIMPYNLQRVLYSLAMSAAAILSLSVVLGGLVCRATPTFDFHGALLLPLMLVTAAWFAFLPMWFVVALIIFPFTRGDLWHGNRRTALFAVPAVILLGFGSFSVMLAHGPGSGCF